MPKKQSNKRPKRAFDVSVLQNELQDYDKERVLQVVDRVCRGNALTEQSSLTEVAQALVDRAYQVDMEDRKPLAVLCRRLHDRLPRFPQLPKAEGGTLQQETVTLASCMAQLCENALADVLTRLQESAGICSGESSFSGEANDENHNPAPSPAPSAVDTPVPSTPGEPAPGPKPQSLSPLQQLHALQTFSACLYTQDIVSEMFLHNIIDRVRFGSSAWPAPAQNAAVVGVCDMFTFCGKRLESLGAMRAAMPEVYTDLQKLADAGGITDATRARIADVVVLRARNWVPEAKEEPQVKAGPAAAADADVALSPPEISLAPAGVKDEGDGAVTFSSMLAGSGIKVSGVAGDAAAQPDLQPDTAGQWTGMGSGGFPYLEEDAAEPAVKMEDMLAAVCGIDA